MNAVLKVVWKSMILNFMERYFYLICFGTYALQVQGVPEYLSTFLLYCIQFQFDQDFCIAISFLLSKLLINSIILNFK